jgi:hypothetical protein
MRSQLKRFVRDAGVRLLRACGSDIVDAETGAVIGRALLVPWRGRIKVIGLETPVRPVFLAQPRLTYWKQELGFTTHPPPDFPRCGKGP